MNAEPPVARFQMEHQPRRPGYARRYAPGIKMEESSLLKSLAKPIETACKLVESLLGKPFEVAGESLSDQVQHWQWQNRVRIATKVEKILDDRDIPRRILLPDFLLPLMRDCGDAADDDLQSAWANLLVAAIESDASEHVAFISTLKQLSPLDARVLNALINHGYIKRDERATVIANLLDVDKSLVQLSFDNFVHLGFFSPSQRALRGFAKRFVRAIFGDDDALNKYIESQDKGGAVLVD